jgi:hypothetical protein
MAEYYSTLAEVEERSAVRQVNSGRDAPEQA